MADVVVVVGDAVVDVVVRLHGPPQPGSDTPASITTHPGGQGANTAAWLARAGAAVALVGCVGMDAGGERLSSALAGAGVDDRLERHPSLPSGAIVVLVGEDGERTMLTDRGANRALGALPERLAGRHLHLSGYVLLDDASRAAGLRVLDSARARGWTVSVSASSRAPLLAAGGGAFREWTTGADVCLANRAEAGVLTGDDDPERAATALLDDYRAAVVTCGPAGAWWAGHEVGVGHVPAAAADVVDTTGAGDALTAGFLAGWLAGFPLAEAVARGAELARLALAEPGSWPSG